MASMRSRAFAILDKVDEDAGDDDALRLQIAALRDEL
jgi:hypothetical protein